MEMHPLSVTRQQNGEQTETWNGNLANVAVAMVLIVDISS